MMFFADHTISYGDVVLTIIGLVVTGFIPVIWKMHALMATFKVQLNGLPHKVRLLSEDMVEVKTKMKMKHRDHSDDSSNG